MHHVAGLLSLLTILTHAAGEFSLQRSDSEGTAMLMENDTPVLVFNHGDQLAGGFDQNRTRSCYVHPIFGLDGEVLTDDFPEDHPHHRGASMMWPRMRIGDLTVDQWHIDGMNKNWHSAPPRGSTLRVPADLLGGCSRVLRRGVGCVAAQ